MGDRLQPDLVRRARRHGVDLNADLQPFDGRLEQEGDYEQLSFDTLDLSDQEAHDARLLDCSITSCNLDEVHLDRAHVIGTTITASRAGALHLPRGSWRDVVVRDCRLGAVQAHGATFTQVSVVGGKLDYLNLRGARIDVMRLTGVTIGDLDLGDATVKGLVVDDCRIGRLNVQGARLTDVDLRGADLRALDGLAGLAGATITEDQLTALAPAMAAHLRITVRPV